MALEVLKQAGQGYLGEGWERCTALLMKDIVATAPAAGLPRSSGERRDELNRCRQHVKSARRALGLLSAIERGAPALPGRVRFRLPAVHVDTAKLLAQTCEIRLPNGERPVGRLHEHRNAWLVAVRDGNAWNVYVIPRHGAFRSWTDAFPAGERPSGVPGDPPERAPILHGSD